jgi:hypothetical protein
MANTWLRLWHDMPNDPKWRTIARIAGQPIALVQAVYLQLLVSASQNPVTDETGVTLRNVTVTNEDIASALDVTESNVKCITDAMQGRVLDGITITGWDKRQAPAASRRTGANPPMTGAERAKAYRERKKKIAEEERNVTEHNVTVTQSNAVTRQIRKEEIRKEDKELKDQNTLVHGEKDASEPDGFFSSSDCSAHPETGSELTGQASPGKNDAGYPAEFERVWQEYPCRAGANPKRSAFSAWNARRREGTSPEVMLAGVRRYVRYLQSVGRAGTEFVQRASTFFGPDRNFEDAWTSSVLRTSCWDVDPNSPPDTSIPEGFRG